MDETGGWKRKRRKKQKLGRKLTEGDGYRKGEKKNTENLLQTLLEKKNNNTAEKPQQQPTEKKPTHQQQ